MLGLGTGMRFSSTPGLSQDFPRPRGNWSLSMDGMVFSLNYADRGDQGHPKF
ncbi:hypothetical protein HMI54_001855 [Coelomomyces lativittatus]|nr:hypothetical protein HMI54_001855 [Coelomomyces lativittatus]KAJ1515259.1 hypothetical protein HMI56_006196 [Coelomomyces lativittatus]